MTATYDNGNRTHIRLQAHMPEVKFLIYYFFSFVFTQTFFPNCTIILPMSFLTCAVGYKATDPLPSKV